MIIQKLINRKRYIGPMKKRNHKNLAIKLTAYSCVAIAVAATSPTANAELVGNDVDPDSTRSIPADTSGYYQININNSGAACDAYLDFDLTLGIFSNGWQYLWLYGWRDNRALAVPQLFELTSVVITITSSSVTTYGNINTWTATYLGTKTYTFYSGIAGSSGSSAGKFNMDSRSWYKWPTMVLNYGVTSSSWGQWAGKTQKYQGLQFYAYVMDTITTPGDTTWDSTFHYGWLYMDVGIDANWFTVRAWAYDDVPWTDIIYDMGAVNWNKPCTDENIDSNKWIGISDRNLENKVSIYSYESNIKVSLTELASYSRGIITVYDVTGRKVQQQPLNGRSNLVTLKGNTSGVYMVRVEVDGYGTRSKSVFIE